MGLLSPLGPATAEADPVLDHRVQAGALHIIYLHVLHELVGLSYSEDWSNKTDLPIVSKQHHRSDEGVASKQQLKACHAHQAALLERYSSFQQPALWRAYRHQ